MKVIIIGAGVAGLTCGVYARLNGFETEIYESHTIPGGECTGWDRKGYHFDGCVHWLMGSKPGTAMHDMWRTAGAIDDSVKFWHHKVFTRYEKDGKEVVLYTDADKLEKHLLEIAPEDKKQIKKLCRAIRVIGSFNMPLDKPIDMMTAGDGIKFLAANLRSLPSLFHYKKMCIGKFAASFKNDMLKSVILASYPEKYSCMSLVNTLAGINSGDCGYPLGGSRAMADRMERRYLDLGGRVFYKSRVAKILVENGKAVGIKLTDGKEVFADHVVSCADAYATLKFMLDDKYTPAMYKKLFSDPEEYPTVTSSIVFLGVDAKIPHTCRNLTVHRGVTVSLGGEKTDVIRFLNQSLDEDAAPEGKMVMACYYRADYDFWNSIYGDKEKYKAEKVKLAQDAIAMLERRFPETKGKVEVTDVVTPMTYQRYCGAWRGSWMTWTRPDSPQYYSGVLPSLENFIMAGMWTLPPGGLPGAAVSGRFAAHRICIQNGIPFKAK